jgi:hypothetical protein
MGTPDFLLILVASAIFMRLSLTKAAHADVGECCVAGNTGTLLVYFHHDLRLVQRTAVPSATLRSGRDDKSEGGASERHLSTDERTAGASLRSG